MFLIAPLLPEPKIDWHLHVEIVEQACRDANMTKDRAARIYGVSSAAVRPADSRHRPLQRAAPDPDGVRSGRQKVRALVLSRTRGDVGRGDVARIYRIGLLCTEVTSRYQVTMLKAQLRARGNEDDGWRRWRFISWPIRFRRLKWCWCSSRCCSRGRWWRRGRMSRA